MTKYLYDGDGELVSVDGQDPDVERVDDALERAEGIDQERAAELMREYLEAGVPAVDALEAAVDAFDHSEDGDELAALERISAREGWS